MIRYTLFGWKISRPEQGSNGQRRPRDYNRCGRDGPWPRQSFEAVFQAALLSGQESLRALLRIFF